MVRCSILTVVVALALPAVQRPLHAAQIHLTKGVSERNLIPNLAFDDGNGNLQTVWTRQLAGTNTIQIWGRLLKRKKNGKYKRKPARMISEATGWNANADVAYIPWLKRWLVTWDTYNFAQPTQASMIKGRFLKRKSGKTRGTIKNIVTTNRGNTWPKILAYQGFYPGSPGATGKELAQDIREIVIVITAFPTAEGQKRTGVVLLVVTNKLRPKPEPRFYSHPIAAVQIGANLNFDSQAFASNIFYEQGAPGGEDRDIGVAVGLDLSDFSLNVDSLGMQRYFDWGGTPEVAETDFGDNLFRGTQWSKQLGVNGALYQDQQDRSIQYQAFEPTMQPGLTYTLPYPKQKVEADYDANRRDYGLWNFQPQITFEVPGDTPAPQAGELLGYIVHSLGGKTVKRATTAAGAGAPTPVEISDETTPLFTHNGRLRWLSPAVWFEDNTSAVAWGKFVNGTTEEIWVYVD